MIQKASLPSDTAGLKQWAFPESSALEKSFLRCQMREKRQNLDGRIALYKARKIAENLISLPILSSAKTVALYASMPDEVDTDSIATVLLQQGKKICYPVVCGNDLVFFSVTNLVNDLSRQGVFGIREPRQDGNQPVNPAEIDVFIVPGLVFDIFGGRVGFGRGFYDRYLLRKRPDAHIVAAGFDFQVVHALCTSSDDIPVDIVVTENEIYSSGFSACQSTSEHDTVCLAEKFYDQGLRQGGVIILHAGLGTGKTVFVRGLSRKNQCKEETASPTFIYCREYHGIIPIYHIDGYRVDSLQRADSVFWEELLEQYGLVAVEWGEQLGMLIPKSAVHLFGQITGEEERVWTLFTPLLSQKGLHPSIESF